MHNVLQSKDHDFGIGWNYHQICSNNSNKKSSTLQGSEEILHRFLPHYSCPSLSHSFAFPVLLDKSSPHCTPPPFPPATTVLTSSFLSTLCPDLFPSWRLASLCPSTSSKTVLNSCHLWGFLGWITLRTATRLEHSTCLDSWRPQHRNLLLENVHFTVNFSSPLL